MQLACVSIETAFGALSLFAENDTLVAVEWGWVPSEGTSAVLAQATDQIEAYFDGGRQCFTVPLAPSGTPFQHAVWSALSAIPYGTVTSYGALALFVGTGPRAVARACARNPLPLFIPCHRVVGADGTLGGYSGGEGVATKAALLRLEGLDPDHRLPLS